MNEGVQFKERDGKRSSHGSGKRVFAAAAGAVDSSLASRIESSKDWRKEYIPVMRELAEAGVRSPKDVLLMAADGLAALHSEVEFERNGETSTLRDALRAPAEPSFSTTTVDGSGAHPGEVTVPYRGQLLRGGTLVRQIARWEGAGVIEPSCAEALRLVVQHPEWLDLSDRSFVLVGAAAEMGPLEWLSAWGAEVIALDLPRPNLWQSIVEKTVAGSGRTQIPMRGPATDESDIPEAAGADLLTETPEIAAWLRTFDRPLVLGNYAYADGGTFVRVATALDALIESFLDERDDVSLAYLATPTDVFAVPGSTVEATRSSRSGVVGGAVSASARALTIGRGYAPNYASTVEGENGRIWGIADSLVPQQGPNYALAKSLQRWRALKARSEGTLTSANVAPATRTLSVTKNKVLAAAYNGAPLFGVEIFEPETSRALMSALLVHDIRNPGALSNPDTPLEHPFDLLAQGAAHGGLWRMRYEPRSVLPLAVMMGFLRRY